MRALSIVFQGSVEKDGVLSRSAVNNIIMTRRAFPASEIIVSTWHMSPDNDMLLQTLMDDIGVSVIFSDDPGPLTVSDGATQYVTNLNRMLVSSCAGLDAASRPLSIKLRTDTWLSGRGVIKLLDTYVTGPTKQERNDEFSVFRARVINASWFARDVRGSLPYLFHPGDIFLAGWTDDLRLFFSAPLADKQLFNPASIPGLWTAWKYVPEQWLWVHAIYHATGRWVYEGNFNHTPKSIEMSEDYFLANFVPCSARSLHLHWPKYWRCYPFRGLFSTMTHRRWLRLVQTERPERTAAPYSLPERCLIAIWRKYYTLRALLLQNPVIRRCAVWLFQRRR